MSSQVYVGIDAGSRATKIVVLDAEGEVLRRGMIDQSVRPAESAKRLFDVFIDGLLENYSEFVDDLIFEVWGVVVPDG